MSVLNAMSSLFSTGRKMAKIKDSLVLGLTSGFLATLVMDIFNLAMFSRKKSEFLYGHLAASMIMRPFRTHQRKNFMLGQIFQMITGSILGIPMVYILKKTGRDYHLIKGAAMGLFAWGVLYDFGQRMNFFSARAHLTRTHYTTLLTNLVYGMTAAQMSVSLGDDSLFPSKEKPETQNTSKWTSKPWTETQIHPNIDTRSNLEKAKDVPLPTPDLDKGKQKQVERQMH